MRELTNKKTKFQNILFITTHRLETISAATCFRAFLPTKIADFYRTSFRKHLKLTEHSSVEKLPIIYLSFFGVKIK